MSLVLTDYVLTLGWVFALVIILSVALPILVWVFNKVTGEINIGKELKRKNMAVAILLGAVVLGAALIIASIV